jgi:hypothetical protein
VKLRVVYHRAADLLADDAAQFQKGGLLVRVEPPPELALFDSIELELGADFADSIRVSGQVVQLIPGAGVAVAFARANVAALNDAARTAPERAGPPPTHERADVEPARPQPAARPTNEAAAKIHAALYGNRDERMRIMRDVNKMMHPYVLRNPGLGLDEVLAIAKMNTVAPDLLATIAERREWAQRPDIAIALVRNPKTPTPAAVKLLEWVSAADLRQLAKDTRTRPAVQQAARKKVIG